MRDVCNAAVFLEPGRPLEPRVVPLPTPGPGEALVRIECCTICGSDLHTLAGKRSETRPSILGHEIVGVVERIGDPRPVALDGEPLAPGDRITWSVSISCGRCDRCARGLTMKCRTLAKYGHERAEGRHALSGGLAEYLLLREGSSAIRVSPDMPAEVICPVNCATATVAAAMRMAGPLAGERVLIFGAGMLGLTACAFARSRGAKHIAIVDISPERLELTSRFGADRPSSRPEGEFDVVLELSGSAEAVAAAIERADVGGRVVLVGSVMPSPAVPINPERVVRRWLTIQGVHNYAPADLQTAVDFLIEHGNDFPFARLVESTHSLQDVNLAIERAIKTRPIRIAIRP